MKGIGSGMLHIAIMTIALMSAAASAPSAGDIVCEGRYGGHLQGIAVDGMGHVYWSFTVDLVKTDMDGRVIAARKVPTHHGDLTWRDGNIYVAVNLGDFNREAGHADSWVYVYDGSDLSFLSRHEVPEVVHGAGGMAWDGARFVVIGGLPEGYDVNYAYEYDESCTFLGRRVIETGYTRLGVQTLCCGGGFWWFGCYGHPDNCALFRTDGEFAVEGMYDTPASVGFALITPGLYLQGFTGRDEDTGLWWGSASTVTLKAILADEYASE